MYSIPCRILCWILIFSQLFACKKISDPTPPPPTHLNPIAVPAADFCKDTSPSLDLATTAPKVQWNPKGDGTNTITFMFDSEYDESFFTWNICPDGLKIEEFKHFSSQSFDKSCQFTQNQTAVSHTFETNLLTAPYGIFYFMACNEEGICKNQVKVEVANLPGSNIPTQVDIQNKQNNYNHNIKLAVEIHGELEKIYKNAAPPQTKAMYGALLKLSTPELADMIQTQDFQDQLAQFVKVDPKFKLADDVKAAANQSCDFGKVLFALENGTDSTDSTDSNTEVETTVAVDTDSSTNTATSSGGGSNTGAWIGKGFAIAGALIGVLYSGYNFGLEKQKYKFNKDQLKWAEKTYLNDKTVPTIEDAQKRWGEKSTIVTPRKVAWLSPNLAELRLETLKKSAYVSDGLNYKAVTTKSAFSEIKQKTEVLSKSSIKKWGVSTIAGVLVLVATVVVSAVFQLSSTNENQETRLDGIANE